MKIIKSISEMQSFSRKARSSGDAIGFVPTMGYLHEGHMSLAREARAKNAKTVISIFVNPAQFGPSEDFAAYPRDMEGDLEKCESARVDAVFVPDVREMYPEGFSTHVDVVAATDVMEGIRRPGHFRGVATVVLKLFNIVMPARAYFGRKDYQQTVVIRRMARDLNLDAEVVVMPTVREPDGLAMSSRNAYLSGPERAAAPVIYRALLEAEKLYGGGERSAAALALGVRKVLGEEPMIETEYAEVSDTETLAPLKQVTAGAVLAVAARIGKTRLIDNILL